MDPLTHTFTGTALAGAGLKRRTALATPTLVLAANAPDVDVLIYLKGSYAALAFRRGWTHGLPAMVVLPFLVAGLILLWDRTVRRRRRPELDPARPGAVLGISVVGLLTHPVLDWMNTYGMRWLVPFDDRWTYGDALFIVDPWIWLLLGGALFVTRPEGGGWTALWAGFWVLATALVLAAPVPAVASAVWIVGASAVLWLGARPPAIAGRRLVRWSGAGAAAYVGLMVVADLAAASRVEEVAQEAGLADVRSVMVAPRPANPLAGDVVVATGAGYVSGSHRWFRRPRVELEVEGRLARRSGTGLARSDVDRAVEGATLDPRARDFLRWSRFPRWRAEPRSSGGYRVRIDDVRYGDAGSLGGLVVTLDEDFRPTFTPEGKGES